LAALSDSRTPALVFIGFMGAGKSKAALAAGKAGLEAVDADAELARELSSPIPEFFAEHGEAEFRAREEALVLGLLERADGGALALGGGSVLSERVREALEPHVVVWLDVDAEDAWSRVERSDRPLARDRKRFEQLHAERAVVYEALADAVVPGRREAVAAAMPALRALTELPPGTRLAWASSRSGDYPAFVGAALLDAGPLGRAAAHGDVGLGGSPFLITDETVGALYADRLGELAGRIEVEPGESAKTLAEAEAVLRELTRLGMSRDDHLIALGGGVVGDLAGFCAATYQRGVSIVQVPTTLVAQVDSAYGGKTGVDLPEAKNYVGAYHQPAAVIADPAVLATLPEAELGAGFVEVIKTGLIAGGALWEEVRGLASLEPQQLTEVIFACARVKLGVVAADERDAGGRQALNLGHTVGHAIEAATGYARYRHGEAVGLGLLAALRLSEAAELREEVEAQLAAHGLPTALEPAVSVDEVLAAVERDKKRTAAGVGFVLCTAPGEVAIEQLVDGDRVRAAVQELADSG
jgi:shikimate kinase/3-dehydroquinate synthase